MSPLVFALVFLLALLLIWWGVRNRAGRGSDSSPTDALDTVAAWPPQATRVLTTPERQAYDLLRNALPAHMILAQVPLQRFIKVPTRNSYAEWLRRVGHLSADFVICDRHSQVIGVVELRHADEQPSGRARRRQDRLMKVLAAAHIKVHEWSAESLPTIEAAREAIAPAPPAEEPVARPVGAKPAVLTEPAVAPNEASLVREPPPSTWFDDLDTGPAPLDVDLPHDLGGHKDRPAR